MQQRLFLLPAILMLAGNTLLAADVDTTKVDIMDEIVVVSTPKEHDALRRQPLSASTMGVVQLRQLGVTNIKDLTANIPGLFIPDYGSRLTSSIYLRGVGSRIGTPAVTMYVDNIPMPDMSSMDQDISDAERIDVLRGPQSTLYGHGTMGGLVRVFTKSPLHYQGTDVMLGYATYNNYRARVMHYHRLNSRLAFSGGVVYERQGSFFANQALNGRSVDGGDDLSLRWRGIYLPSDRVSIDLSARYQWTSQGGYPYMAIDGEDAGQVAYDQPSHYKRHLLNIGLHAQHDLGAFMLSSITGYQMLRDDMLMDQDFSRQSIYTLQQKQNSRNVTQEVALKSKKSRQWQWTSGINVQYQHVGTQAPVTFMQDGLDWLSDMTNTMANRFMPKVQSGPMTMAFNFSDRLEALDGTPSSTGVPFNTDFTSPTLTAGLFHQSTLADLFGAKGLSLSAGLRLEYERIGLNYNAGYAMRHTYSLGGHLSGPIERDITMVPAKTYDVSGRLEGSLHDDYLQLMPRASLQYEWGPTGSVYAGVSRGYRSGGYNIQMFNELLQPMMRTAIMQDVASATIPVLEAQPMVPADAKAQVKGILTGMATPADLDVDATVRYKPETAWNYELGSHLNLWDGRLTADLSAYWIESRDLQVSRMSDNGMGRVTVNAGESRSIGMEAGLNALLTDHLTASGSYSFTHATLKATGTEAHPDDYRVPFAPMHTMSAGACYVWNTRGWADHISLSANGRGCGRTYWNQENTLVQGFYALLDARLAVSHGDMELALWGQNLTGTQYHAFSFVTRGNTFVQRGRPMQLGIDLRLKL